MYDNQEDARMRLMESIIRYKGQPVYIQDVDCEMTVSFSYLETGEGGCASIEDPLFDPMPAKLGYVNYNGGSVYVQRVPVRRWKQGLNRENVRASSHGCDMESRDIINTKEMALCMKDEYPTFDEALGYVSSGRYLSTAYCRDFSLLKEDETGLVWLMYRAEKAGYVHEGVPVLGDSHQYLKEELLCATS